MKVYTQYMLTHYILSRNSIVNHVCFCKLGACWPLVKLRWRNQEREKAKHTLPGYSLVNPSYVMLFDRVKQNWSRLSICYKS